MRRYGPKINEGHVEAIRAFIARDGSYAGERDEVAAIKNLAHFINAEIPPKFIFGESWYNAYEHALREGRR